MIKGWFQKFFCDQSFTSTQRYVAINEHKFCAMSNKERPLLRVIAYNSSTKGNKSEITENCESEKWGSTHRHTREKIDDVSKENTDDVSKENTDDVSKENNKKVSFDNVTEEK